MRLVLLLSALLAPLQTFATQELCGLGTAEQYSPWIADNYGRLLFPIYNQESIAAEVEASKINLNASKPCIFDPATRNSVCTGRLDQIFIQSLGQTLIESFIVNDYKVEGVLEDPWATEDPDVGPTTEVAHRLQRSLHTSRKTPSANLVELSDDNYKASGDVFSTEIGIGMRISVTLLPNTDYNGFTLEGDAFSNELRVGWRVQGDVLITDENNTLGIVAKVSTLGSSGWRFVGNGLVQDWTSDLLKWKMEGSVSADFLPTPLAFSGTVDTTLQSDSSWQIAGRAIVKPLLILWTVEASATPSTNEHITIPGGTFLDVPINHLLFRNSYFMGDFDKDAFQGIMKLKTITFLDSKLEEVPPLDYLFNNLTELQAVYIEGSSMPNIKLGLFPSLSRLELLSFKGSGPLQLDATSFVWLMGSNLTYLNLQDSNTNIAPGVDAVLMPVRATLRFLDLSYTSLVEETALEAMLNGLWITHLSLAGLQLRKVPRSALEHVSNTTRFLTLRGNNFRKVPEENMFSVILDFPSMPNLEELDLKRCGINFIETGVFDGLPALKRLYLAYNNVENVQPGWYLLKPGVLHIDLSWNGVSVDAEPVAPFSLQPGDGLKNLDSLQIADLSNAILTYPDLVVQDLPNTIKELSLCYTNIGDSSLFQDLDLPNLTVLDVSGNPTVLFSAPETVEFLYSLKKLRRLHARNNRITNTLLTAIREYVSIHELSVFIEPLTILDLSGNNIKTLTASFFSVFPNLEMIDLTGNSITAWTDSITITPALRTLKISNNKIETITDIMIQDLSVLQELEIGRNPFECDCNVQRLAIGLVQGGAICSANLTNVFYSRGVFTMRRNQYCKQKAVHSVIKSQKCAQISDWANGSDYYCYTAEGDELMLLRDITTTDLCVAAEVANTAQTIDDLSGLYIGVAVIISFALVVAFIYWKWWEIRLLTRAVRNAAILSFLDHDEEDLPPPQYSAFVSYSDKDRQWVLQHLLPRLEKWSDISVCLHERDFQVGLSIMENIVSSMERSRNLVLILSQAFIKSQWCQFELQLAQHRLVESRRDRLLLVLLEPIPSYRRPKTLRYLMRTNTYLEWPGSNRSADVDRFWSRLLRSLESTSLAPLAV